MNTNILLIALVAVIILGGGAYYFTTQNGSDTETADMNDMDMDSQDTGSSAMRAEENMVVVMEQKPGNTIIASQIYLAQPGYLVIHDTEGAILGASSLLPAGESNNVRVTLNVTTKDGEMYHAMLHNELNGNTQFNEAADVPVESRMGGPIMGMFMISADAPENTPVSI